MSALHLALRAIAFYQRYLSPHKGFCCAHAALHGGESCSAATARIIRQDGLLRGYRRVAARFAECRQAHRQLRREGGHPLTYGAGGPRVRGVFCCGPLPIPFRCG